MTIFSTIGSSSAIGPTIPTSFVTDAGTATPALNILNVLGGANINTSGAGNTVTINLDNQILQPNGSSVAPSYSFSTAPGEGYYYDTVTNTPAFAWGGSRIASFGFTTKINNILEVENGLALDSYTRVIATPFTATTGNTFISVDTSTLAITVRLPNAPRSGQVYLIKDGTGNAAANNITLTTVGGVVTIDGATSVVMGINYESLSVIFNGTSYEVF